MIRRLSPSTMPRTLRLLLTLLVTAAALPVAAEVPLFADNSILEMRVEAPLKALGKADSGVPMPGRLTYAGQTFDVEVESRGHFRKENCKMPPLWLRFDKEQVKDTLFDDQKRVKLVSFCRDNDRYEQYVLLEYLVYRFYNLVEPYSYLTRPARIVYVDSEGGKETEARFSFLIEHKRLLRKRLDVDDLEIKQITPADQNPEIASRIEMFAYMVGNTDWSAIRGPEGDTCCHNAHLFLPAGKTIGPPGLVIPVAYDFDQTGFVSPSYSQVNEDLGIRSVKQRLYRGWCRDPAIQEATYELFNSQRAAIEQMVNSLDGMDDKTRKKALKYLGDFFEIAEDPKARAKKIDGKCRGKR